MRKTAEMLDGTRKRKSLHDKLIYQWEVENADELGDDADFDNQADVGQDDYADGFED